MDIDPSSIELKGIAHRGFSKLAPENTLPAFELAKEKNFEYVECDVRFTLDDIPVLIHDDTINRTSTGRGKVSEMTLQELSVYDYGSWKGIEFKDVGIMTFEDFLEYIDKEKLKAYVEIKDEDISDKQRDILIEAVKKYDLLEDITWISYSVESLQSILNLDERARIGLVGNISEDLIEDVKSLKTDSNEIFLNVSHRRLSKRLIEKALDEEIPVEVWTVDNLAKVKRLVKLGVTGITTNALEIKNIVDEYFRK